MAEGRIDRESALALIEDFFISFNIDSDIYNGLRQGDNGQSLKWQAKVKKGEATN